jgi:hypothetical protein
MKRKKSPKTTGSPSFASPEIAQIEQLLQFMTEHNLEEFEYSRGDLRIRLRKPAAGVYLAASPLASAGDYRCRRVLYAGPRNRLGPGHGRRHRTAGAGVARSAHQRGFAPGQVAHRRHVLRIA